MANHVIGQTTTRFWNGERYVFKWTGLGWECIYQDTAIIPQTIIDDLED
jgi:hypothetical protein